MKYCIIVGTRPEIIKLSPLIREMTAQGLDFFIIHTNQHYSKVLDSIFFEELGLPKPKYNLEIGSGTHGEQTGRMIITLEKILKEEMPQHLYVQGDTNTVVAGVMAAAKELSIKIHHVEAGLRSYDRTMPEEINRVIADHVSDYLYVPTKTEEAILIQEGIPKKNIHIVGNTIVDAVYQNIKLAETQKNVANDLGLEDKKYFLLTVHRPSNVDDPKILQQILNAVQKVSSELKLKTVFPCHPRTKKIIDDNHLLVGSDIIITEPIGYLQMLKLLQNANLVLTDSGGIQEEACILKVLCVTLRNNTERPDTLEVGGNILAGNDYDMIIKSIKEIRSREINWYNPFGDGRAAKKILEITNKL